MYSEITFCRVRTDQTASGILAEKLLPENGLHLKAELPRPFSYLAAFQIPLAHKAVRRQLFRCAFPLRCVTCAR